MRSWKEGEDEGCYTNGKWWWKTVQTNNKGEEMQKTTLSRYEKLYPIIIFSFVCYIYVFRSLSPQVADSQHRIMEISYITRLHCLRFFTSSFINDVQRLCYVDNVIFQSCLYVCSCFIAVPFNVLAMSLCLIARVINVTSSLL